MKKKQSDIRSRCFHLVLYKEDNDHLNALDLIQNEYNFAYILHDKDIIEDTGELKKPHWHVILYFDNPHYLLSLAKDLGIKPNYIKTDELKKGLEYLIHKNNTDKYQYPIDEVKGPLKDKLLTFLGNSSQVEKQSILLLYQLINSFDGPIYLNDFIPLVLENNLWSFFRRSQLTWFKLLEEHNRSYHVNSFSNILKK